MTNSVPRSKSTILVIVCLLTKFQSAFQYIIDVVNLGDAVDFGSRTHFLAQPMAMRLNIEVTVVETNLRLAVSLVVAVIKGFNVRKNAPVIGDTECAMQPVTYVAINTTHNI